MAETAIEWAHYTWNPWRGCSKVHTGCLNCYAERNVGVKLHGIQWGTSSQGGTRTRLADQGWRDPGKWNRRSYAAGLSSVGSPENHRVFCASLADIFETWDGPILDHTKTPLMICQQCRRIHHPQPEYGPGCCGLQTRPLTMDDLRLTVGRQIRNCEYLDWLLLTKRPASIRGMAEQMGILGLRNVWHGTSVSDQPTANLWVSRLVRQDLGQSLRWVSVEPLVGPVKLDSLDNGGGGELYDALRGVVKQPDGNQFRASDAAPLDWVVVGGESGPGARVCDVRWILDLVRQCQSAGVPVFVKQLGSNVIDSRVLGNGMPGAWWPDGTRFLHRAGSRYRNGIGLQHKKGGDPAEWPERLRVRQLPARS